MYLDRQQVQQAQTSALQGLRRYSAAFCGDDEDTESAISPPPPPRASPEPPSPRLNSPELVDSAEESFSEDDDNRDIINKSSETRSLSSEASHSLVFAIPTAGNEGTGSDDEETPSDFNTGRLSADYVAKSEFLLHQISSKSQTETAEISDMLLDMENTQDKISQLRISPRDLDLESTSGATTPSAHLENMQIECAANPAGTEPQHDIGYETFWIEEPPGSYISNALPSRYTRVCSARYLSQHKTSRVRKQQSEGSLVLKGKTVEFFNSEDLAARNRVRDRRRNSIPNDVTEGEHEMLEKRKENTSSASKVG